MLYNKVNGISEKKNFTVVLFFVYLILALFLYRNTIGCRLVTDAQNWLVLYDTIGWSGIINSFGDQALHPGYHFFFFLSYKIFGTNEVGWYLLFTSLHALNALLIYLVFNKYLALIKISDNNLISLSASFLFLISPYQTEVVVWGATIHYLLVTAAVLITINLVILYIQKRKLFYIILILFLFCFAILSSELALCIPFIITLLFLFIKGDTTPLPKKEIFIRILLPLLLLTSFYFAANKLILGSWVGHYGASTHLKFSIGELISNFVKYVFKFLFFGNFFAGTLKEKFTILTDTKYVIYLTGGILIFFVFLYLSIKRFRTSINKSIVLFLCFGAALLPVLNLDTALLPDMNLFFNTLPIEGDRLGYLASAFIFLSLCVFLFSIYRKGAFIIVLLFSVISVFLLNKNLASWKNAGIIQNALEKNFDWEDSDRLFILNIPDNFNGAYLYRDNGSSSKFKTALQLKENTIINGDVYEILHFNMTSLDNGIITETIDSLTLKVSFEQWGNWWWRGGIGASDYENELYKVDIDEWSHAYIITFKQKRPEDIFIYQTGDSWQQVKEF